MCACRQAGVASGGDEDNLRGDAGQPARAPRYFV